jgi:hypothetical protein
MVNLITPQTAREILNAGLAESQGNHEVFTDALCQFATGTFCNLGHNVSNLLRMVAQETDTYRQIEAAVMLHKLVFLTAQFGQDMGDEVREKDVMGDYDDSE